MKYLCLVYRDEGLHGALTWSDVDALEAERRAYDDELRRGGHYLESTEVDELQPPMTLRVRDNTLFISDAPIAETQTRFDGYVLIEARDLNEAILIASRLPSARVGGVEVRPVKSIVNACTMSDQIAGA
jgi:hypothetical protein